MWADRVEAGRLLAEALVKYKDSEAVVLGIPRGGVVIAAEIAKYLNLPLDIVLAKKIGAPMNPELAIGAVAEDGTARIDNRFAAMCGATPEYLSSEIDRLTSKMAIQRERLNPGRPGLASAGRTYIVADDGIATGATVMAATGFLKDRGAKIVVAAPVCAPDTAGELASIADETVFLLTPTGFSAVGQFYADFSQVEDETVQSLLASARERISGHGA